MGVLFVGDNMKIDCRCCKHKCVRDKVCGLFEQLKFMGMAIIPSDYLDAEERQKRSASGNIGSYVSYIVTPDMVNVSGHVFDAMVYANINISSSNT